MNIYAPNNELNQFNFFHFINNTLNRLVKSDDYILIGGDFNTIFDKNLDRKGGSTVFTRKHDDIVNILKDIIAFCQLNDTWRLKHPDKKRFTWRQRTPPIHSRLDYWLTSDTLFDTVEDIDIIPGLRSDHSAITLHLSSIKNQQKGKGLWKLNNSFLKEDIYIKGLTEHLQSWQIECGNIDPRGKWEYLKYKIRQFSITYGKQKVKRLVKTQLELENKLKILEESLDAAINLPDSEALYREIDATKSRLEEIDNYKTEGLILRSRCQWFEKGEKSNDYFLSLVNRNRVKKNMNKLQRQDGTVTIDHIEILEMQSTFYETLYSNQTEKN